MSTFQTSNKLSRIADLLSKARTCFFWSRGRLLRPPSCMLACLSPAIFRTTFFTPVFFETSFNFSCMALHSPTPIAWYKARHNTTRSSSISRGPQFCRWDRIFDVSTKNCCVACWSLRGVSTSTPSVRHACGSRVFIEALSRSSLSFCQLSCGDERFCVVYRNELHQGLHDPFYCPQAFLHVCPHLVFFRRACGEFHGANRGVTLSIWRSIRRENYMFFRSVTNLQGEQSVRLSPVIWLSTCSTPPTNHVFPVFTMIGRDRPQEVLHGEQVAVLTHIVEGNSTSFFGRPRASSNPCSSTRYSS